MTTDTENIYYQIRDRIVPGLRYNQALYEDILHTHIATGAVWLDGGCGWKILSEWRLESEVSLVDKTRLAIGVDTDLHAISKHRTIGHRVICNLCFLPFKPDSLDAISLNMVMEHVEQPTEILSGFAVALKPGGKVIVHTPHKWSYFALLAWLAPDCWKRKVRPDGRQAEDYYSVRYRCNSPKTMRKIASQVGFEEVQTSLYASDAVCQVLAGSMFGRFLLRVELLLIRLSLVSSFRWLRVTMCAVYRRPLR